ncbi:BQ5605_C024g09786 [Microbotryum silenes-dioicae]|uniref:BQ5605_C024g09786 protein n=1 Tax=Microbotryum silenes-dioicae TaxID=796604 RepID=A0A2X0PFA2_9BASI|nr:BQ5605_C024g09786 [Microbotryum silenes-dioicae]
MLPSVLRRPFRIPGSTTSFLTRMLSSSSASSPTPLLVTPSQVRELLSKRSRDQVVVLDASWHMPNLDPPRNAYDEFRNKRIAGATFWDHDIISTKSDPPVPHNLPSPSLFADACSRLALSPSQHLIFYDTYGVFSSPRALYTFKAFGHNKVSIMEGGLPRWIAEKNPVVSTPPKPINVHEQHDDREASWGPIMSELLYRKRPQVESYFIADIEEHFTEYPEPQLDTSVARDNVEIVANADKGDPSASANVDYVLDARPAGRYHGTDPEPRAGLSSGHIPHSLSLPFGTLLSPKSSTDPYYQTYLPAEELEAKFQEALGKEGWESVKNGERSLVTSCGSGMTAAVVWLGLKIVTEGKARGAVYDESWTGYAAREGAKIEKS